jgi:hypothetical protein
MDSWSQKSTEAASYLFIQSVQEALDSHLHAVGIFLDLSKVYDVLNHSRLLDKLDSYGIRGSVNRWFQSYLTKNNLSKYLRWIEVNRPNTNFNLHRGRLHMEYHRAQIWGPSYF